jgi:group I intron endonuclease
MIYKATNKINGKIYIGRTVKTLEERKYNHEKSTDDTYFHQALRKYGVDNFEWEVIHETDYDNEQYYIEKYNSLDRNVGYNTAIGGTGGDTITNNPKIQEVKSNMSKSSKEVWSRYEHREKMIKIRKEFGNTKEFKDKISQNSKKMWESKEKRKTHSAYMTERWKDPVFREQQTLIRKNNMSGKNNHMSKITKIIDSCGNEYICHGNLREFCNKMDISYSIIVKFKGKGKIPMAEKRNLARERVAGWEVIDLSTE